MNGLFKLATLAVAAAGGFYAGYQYATSKKQTTSAPKPPGEKKPVEEPTQATEEPTAPVVDTPPVNEEVYTEDPQRVNNVESILHPEYSLTERDEFIYELDYIDDLDERARRLRAYDRQHGRRNKHRKHG